MLSYLFFSANTSILPNPTMTDTCELCDWLDPAYTLFIILQILRPSRRLQPIDAIEKSTFMIRSTRLSTLSNVDVYNLRKSFGINIFSFPPSRLTLAVLPQSLISHTTLANSLHSLSSPLAVAYTLPIVAFVSVGSDITSLNSW
jgi:hypothetical protein